MQKQRLAFGAAVVAALAWFAGPARAEGDASSSQDPTRQMIQDEIKAYLKAEKEKKDKEDKEKGVMKVTWKDGVSFESADKKFKAKLIGRIQADYWTFDADKAVEDAIKDEFDSMVYFRRVRMGIDMTILKNTKVKVEYDFARGGTSQSFADVYIGFVDFKNCGMAWMPDVYVGHQKEPFCLDELTSSKYSMFMERALPALTFAPARNTGIKLKWGLMNTKTADEKEEAFSRLLAEVGVFAANANNWGDAEFNDDGSDAFSGDENGWSVTGRLVWLPWVDCSCPKCRVLHLGVAGSYRNDLAGDNLRFRTRPEVGNGPRIVDTGADIVADSAYLLGAEVALVYDRWSVQGEYIWCSCDAPTNDDPVYTGWYVQASYWLTGECRNYEKGKGEFGRVKPCRPLFCEDCCAKGPGGWEIAARFSTVDLNDGTPDVRGGKVWDATVGLNWHWNNNVRVMFNYVHSDVTDAYGNPAGDGTVDAFGVRVAAEW
jgi:phosphate-selective porin OprO/OprP